jgi:hypothetical protein
MHTQKKWCAGVYAYDGVTLGEDACQVRIKGAPQALAALNGGVLALMAWLGVSNVASQMRHFCAHPHEALHLLLGKLSREYGYIEKPCQKGKERTRKFHVWHTVRKKTEGTFPCTGDAQMDVDDKVCEQVSPGLVERIYPKAVIEQGVQESQQWAHTQRRVRQSTGLSLVLFVMMLALWSRLNQRQVWQKLVGGREPLCQMSSSALPARREELGSEVMQALMQTCCKPMASREQTREAFFRRYRLMARDGTLLQSA